jgi:hypothetical protein
MESALTANRADDPYHIKGAALGCSWFGLEVRSSLKRIWMSPIG